MKKESETLSKEDLEWASYYQMLKNPLLRVAALKKISEKGWLNKFNRQEFSFISQSFIENHHALTQFLMENGADYNHIWVGLIAMKDYLNLKKLLQLGGKLTFLNQKGFTVLYEILENSKFFQIDKKMLTFLLDNGLNLNQANQNGVRAICALSRHHLKESLPIFKWLSTQGVELNFVTQSDMSLLRFFLAVRGLHQESEKELHAFYDFLKQHHYHFNQILENKTYLMRAIKNNLSQGHITILMEYVDVSVKTKEGSALNFAIRGKLNFIALKILNKMATKDLDTMFEGVSYLHLALIFSFSDVAQALILRGANIHLKNEQTGKTALHYAISTKQFEIVQLLLEKGADILALDNQQRNALYIACEAHNLAIVRLLIDDAEKKSCIFELIHQKTLSGHTAFFLGVNSHAESAYPITILLLEKSSEFLKNEPLYLVSLILSAYFAGNIKIFELLLDTALKYKHVSENSYHTIKNTLPGERKWSEQELKELLQGTSAQSSASFLKQQGLFASKETSIFIEKTSPSDKAEQPIEAHFTFLNRFHSQHLIQTENGTPNCFAGIYLPEVPEETIAPFKLAAHAFAPSENAHGLVKLKGHYVTHLQYGDKVETVPITHEIKISGTARIYCVEILSDQGRGTMYLGIMIDEDGLHSTKSKQLLEQQKHKTYVIHLPLLEESSIVNTSYNH